MEMRNWLKKLCSVSNNEVIAYHITELLDIVKNLKLQNNEFSKKIESLESEFSKKIASLEKSFQEQSAWNDLYLRVHNSQSSNLEDHPFKSLDRPNQKKENL